MSKSTSCRLYPGRSALRRLDCSLLGAIAMHYARLGLGLGLGLGLSLGLGAYMQFRLLNSTRLF